MFGSKDKNLTPLGGYVIAKNSNLYASIFRLSHPVEKAHYTYVFVLVSTFEMVPHIYTSFCDEDMKKKTVVICVYPY